MPLPSNAPPAVPLGLATGVAEALRRLEWSTAEAVGFSAGTLDVSAERRYERGGLSARVRLAVFCDASDANAVTIAENASADLPLASYALGDDERAQREAIGRALAAHVDPDAALAALHASAYPHEQSLVEPCRVAAPPARAFASRIDGIGTTAAFAAIDAIRRDLLAFDLDVIADDLSLLADAGERAEHAQRSLAFRAASCDLIHVVLVTAATMSAASVRLVRTTLAGDAPRWIDVVQREAVEEYAARITSHYDAQFRRRNFSRAA